MGAFRDPSTINNVGAVGSTTNPLTGSALGMDRENQKAIKELIGTLDWESLMILDGGITPVSSEIIVDTEDGTPADDLTTINLTSDGTTSLHTGMRIKIKSADPSRVITVKHLTGGGNIRTADGQDVVLSNDWSLDLKLQNGEWVEQKGRGDAMATEALGQLQVQGAALGEVRVQGAASWSADGAPYPINAQVYHNGKQWLALRANSVEPAAGADWTEFSAAKYDLGSMEFSGFTPAELPKWKPGWYFMNGDYYPNTSKQAIQLNKLPTGFRERWGIVNIGSATCVPNFFYVDGRGFFMRAADGTKRPVASVQLDAQQKITGHASGAGAGVFNLEHYGGCLFTGHLINTIAGFSTASNGGLRLDFDSSRVVRTAHENVSLNVGMTPVIYLAV